MTKWSHNLWLIDSISQKYEYITICTFLPLSARRFFIFCWPIMVFDQPKRPFLVKIFSKFFSKNSEWIAISAKRSSYKKTVWSVQHVGKQFIVLANVKNSTGKFTKANASSWDQMATKNIHAMIAIHSISKWKIKNLSSNAATKKNGTHFSKEFLERLLFRCKTLKSLFRKGSQNPLSISI